MLLFCPVAGSVLVAFYSVQNVQNLKLVKQLFASLGYVCKHSVQVEGCKLKQQGFQGNIVEGGKLRFKVEHFKQSSIEASGRTKASLRRRPFLLPPTTP